MQIYYFFFQFKYKIHTLTLFIAKAKWLQQQCGRRIYIIRWGKSDGFGGGMQIVSDKIRNFAVGSVPGGVGL